jgi:tetratricopeptide (TPR) repeat protein
MTRHRPAARLHAPLLALLALVVAAVVATPGLARAEECPDNVPANSRERRATAKDWFSRAEAADAGGDPIGAVRAYQCSLKMVPHAFTAFNLGRLAERTGDLELAVDAFNTYIKLAPEAPDRKEIEEKIGRIGERIKTLRQEQEQPVVTPPPKPPLPPVSDTPIDVKSPPPPSGPVISLPPSQPEPSSAARILPWVVGGVGVAALVGGIVLNVSARNKSTEYNDLAKRGQPWESVYDAAKTRAYASYALFGVAAAALVTDGVLFVLSQQKGDSVGNERAVSAALLPGGGAVVGRFKF